jgi:aspyridone synthetase trans-acting enoyl reductase
MVTIPETQKALKIKGPGEIGITTSSPIPHVEANEVLVQVVCVAVNPVDGKSTDLSPSLGATIGCDFSGVIVSIGSEVVKRFSVGDGVCGCVFGNNPNRLHNGAFAEYVSAPADLVFKIPAKMTFQTAATLGVGLSTTGMALYHALKLPLPSSPASEPSFVLVYGGGTATGTLAIQMLRK